MNHASVAIRQAAEEIAEGVARIYGSELEAKDNEILRLHEEIEKLERMLDEAHARVEDLLPKMDGSLMKEEF